VPHGSADAQVFALQWRWLFWPLLLLFLPQFSEAAADAMKAHVNSYTKHSDCNRFELQ